MLAAWSNSLNVLEGQRKHGTETAPLCAPPDELVESDVARAVH
eukprot:SAG22_NODE_7548_length_729_cov_1.444444_1_plen_42_part_10